MTEKADDEKATLLTRKTVYPGKTITLEIERVALPGGHVCELEMIHHPGASCIVPFLAGEDGGHDVVLIRQYRHAAGGFILELPAGKLNPDEAPEACAARELEEETGWRAGRLEAMGSILTTPGFTDERIHLFAAHDLVPGTQATEDSEVLSVVRMPLSEAIKMIHDGQIDDAKTMCALFLAASRSR